jgi:hypothetical protein
MIKKIAIISTTALLSIDTLALPQMGIEITGSNYKFTDYEKNGDSTNYNQISALNAVMIFDVDRYSRIKSKYGYRNIEIASTQEVVGQNGTINSLSFTYQTRFDLNMRHYLWLGFGAGVSKYSLSDRYLVDEEGYIKESFEDINDYGFSGHLNVGREIHLNNYFDLGFSGELEQHFNGNLSVISIGVSILSK